MKQKDYLILNDYLTKFPNNHPYNKPSLKKVNFILSNNKVIGNNKLILPILNTSLAITGQLPSIIRAKKSVASFKLRKNNPVGLTTTLRGLYADRFVQLLKFYILPRLIQIDNKTINLNKFNIKFDRYPVITIGFDNIGILKNIMPLHPMILKDNNLIENTGGYIQIYTKFNYDKLNSKHMALSTPKGGFYQRGKQGEEKTRVDKNIELNKFISYYYLSVLNIPLAPMGNYENTKSN